MQATTSPIVEAMIKPAKKSWHARLELAYKKSTQKTVLSHRLHKGPLVVQKSFYPEGDVCHSYLIHPPGGIVGGDMLELEAELEPQSHALITTPAANKFYRSKDAKAHLYQTIKVDKDATLEWLPQETIFYNDCNAKIHTEFALEEGAHLTCWEINCYGRPAGNEFFLKGLVEQKIIITREGIPLYIDRSIINEKSNILNASWGLNKYPVMATMIVTLTADFDDIELEQIQSIQQHCKQRIVSYSRREQLLIVRYFGYHAREALALFTQCWSVTRPQLVKKQSCPPRIWAT